MNSLEPQTNITTGSNQSYLMEPSQTHITSKIDLDQDQEIKGDIAENPTYTHQQLPTYLTHLPSGRPRKVPLDPEGRKKYQAKLHRESTQRRRQKTRNIEVKNQVNLLSLIFNQLVSDPVLFDNLAANTQFRNFLKKLIEFFHLLNLTDINQLLEEQLSTSSQSVK